MSLQKALDDYEVTVVPGAPRLRLAWSPADDPATSAERTPEPPTADATDTGEWRDLLERYRITRVPVPIAG